MTKINVLKDYDIFIGQGLIKNIKSLVDLSKFSKAVIVTDQNIPKPILNDLLQTLTMESKVIVLPPGDQNKDLDNASQIWQALLDFGCDRKSLVINLGGGMVGDIGGFAASVFMRGLAFLQIPTTLLAQVDESVGGKVGINFSGIKNLIGSFRLPVAVILDIDTLKSLPQREFISGFAEIIKHGAIFDKNYFQKVTVKKPQDFSDKELIDIIEKSCLIKAEIVKQDLKESGPRKLLNFGHTIGHAIEAISLQSSNPMLHGEAVSIGMAAEGKISKILGLLSDEEFKVLESVLVRAGLPVDMPEMPVDKILEKIYADKKNEKGVINWTLLKGIGRAIFNQKVPQDIIRKVI